MKMNTATSLLNQAIPMQDGCWTIPRTPKPNGYIRVNINGKAVAAHRAIYEAVNGPIQEGMDLDHLCHGEALDRGSCKGGVCLHRRCVRPDHMRVVSRSENVLASAHSVDVKDSCPKGHSYSDPNNVMTRRNGHRECAECNRVRSAKNYAKRMTLTTQLGEVV